MAPPPPSHPHRRSRRLFAATRKCLGTTTTTTRPRRPAAPAAAPAGEAGAGAAGEAGGYYPAPPQPAPASDQLLHAIAAHLLLNSAPPPPPQPQPQPQQPPPPPPAAHQANLHSTYAYQYNNQQQQQQQQQGPNPHAYPQQPPPPPPHHQQGPQPHAYPQPPAPPPPPPQQQPYPSDHGQLLLHSLLRRVAALETTLPHCFPTPTPPPNPQPHPNPHRPHRRAAARQEEEEEDPPSPPPRRARGGGGRPPPSVWELAARTIQEHFRRFLARRSRTLRQIKELAVLRSKAASLRGSLSGSGRRRCKDPVAVSEAAMGLLLHLDGIQGGDPMIREGKRAVSRELSRILEFVDKVLVKEHDEMPLDNGEYPEGCNGAPVMSRPTVNKKVSFHCNEAENEADDSSESSSSAEADERKGTNSKNVANGKPGLAAPVPVHMESRRPAGEMR